MAELTKQGYDMILDRILNLKVPYPAPMTIEELSLWSAGYADCLEQIVKVIGELRDGNGR